jgi:hypothetical protein
VGGDMKAEKHFLKHLVSMLCITSASIGSAQTPDPKIEGLIGSTKVLLDRKYVRFLEFDDDPVFLGSSKEKSTLDASIKKIRSFGFSIRYPDISLVEPSGFGSRLTTASDVLFVSVLANSYSGSLTSMEPFVPDLKKRNLDGLIYKKLSEVYNLDMYRSTLESALHARSVKNRFRSKIVYIHKVRDEDADTYIECNGSVIPPTSCVMRFLIPRPTYAQVAVKFPSRLLKEWPNLRLAVQNSIGDMAVLN